MSQVLSRQSPRIEKQEPDATSTADISRRRHTLKKSRRSSAPSFASDFEPRVRPVPTGPLTQGEFVTRAVVLEETVMEANEARGKMVVARNQRLSV
jgi:hypothetical protein